MKVEAIPRMLKRGIAAGCLGIFLMFSGLACQPVVQEAPRVVFPTEDGGEEVVRVEVAETPGERYRGLRDADTLPEGRGMLFVYREENIRSYVMTDMKFPIDMVFVDSDGVVTEIHHARPAGEEGSASYPGRARYVIEVPYEFTRRIGLEVGDRVIVERP